MPSAGAASDRILPRRPSGSARAAPRASAPAERARSVALSPGIAGAATEVGRIAFQSLMQARAPEGSQGRVYVRYEVVFQLSWVLGALIPSVIPIPLHVGTILLAVGYGLLAVLYVLTVTRSRPSP